MTLVKDNNNNVLSTKPTDILLHYLHPDFVDKSDKLYSNNRCPLSMLAETCNNIGKHVTDHQPQQSQDPALPLSPSCSSSCSAPKFSPHSHDQSPIDESRMKEKSKKRKAVKREPQDFMEKRIPLDHNGLLNNPYSISEFLKMNNFPPNGLTKPEQSQFIHPLYNQLFQHNLQNQLQASSIWKSKSAFHPRMPAFPAGYPINVNVPPQMFRPPPQPNLIHELNHIYNNNCHQEKLLCDCVVCCHKKTLEKNLVKVDPVLFNSLNCLRLHRPMSNNLVPQMMPSMPHLSATGNGSTIKYCMYCGNYIPQIQNLLSHIHSEHVDQISSNFQPKTPDSIGANFNFNVENFQTKEMKSREILKQLHMLYNGDSVDEHCADKPLLMR